MRSPLRGEVWFADLNPTRGHEQAGRRPVLVVSHDVFSRGPAELAVVLPITSRLERIRSHVRLDPPEGGLRSPSAIMCEAIRSVSRERLIKRFGRVGDGTMGDVDDVLTILLDL